jgi:outer membrane lipoprotein-sorting protein
MINLTTYPAMTCVVILGQILFGVSPDIALAQQGEAKAKDDPRNNTQAREYINKMAAAYKGMKSYSGTAKVSAEMAGQPKMQIEARVTLQRPHFAAMRFKEGSDNNFSLFDGKALFATSSRHKKQYVKQSLSPNLGIMRVLSRAGMTGPGLTLLFNQPDTLKTFAEPSSLSLRKPATIAGVSVVTVVSQSRQGQGSMTVTYHIGRKDYLLRQLTLVQSVGGKTVTMTELHTNIKVNAKLPSSTFRFTPPHGAKPIKAFSK